MSLGDPLKHELKIWPQYYSRVVAGELTYQVRNNDREFQFGDTVVLKEWDPTPVNSTTNVAKGYVKDSEPLEFRVGYVQILRSDEVVFSLLPINNAEKPQTRSKKVK